MPSRGPLKIAGQTGLVPRQLAFPEASSRPKQWWSAGLALSLLLHSLPLLGLIGWQPHPAEIPTPIPIELVVEQPPPAPPIPEPPAIPPRVRSASADMAEKVASKLEQGADSSAQPASEPRPEPQTAAAEPPPQPRTEPERPAEPQTATTAPPPQPEPAPSQEQAEPTAEETKTAALTPPVPLPPKPAPHKREPAPVIVVPMASAWPLPLPRERRPAPTERFAAVAGPSAIRDEYCVRALNLTLRHLDLLPRSYVGDRRGRTVVTIRILGDGTINSVKVAQSSGFADIDRRVERMVFAVGQYPPLPPRMQGPWMDFSFIMVFPEAIEQ